MSAPKITVARHSEREIVGDNPASAIGLLADSADTGGVVSSHRTAIEAGGRGAPPHSHGTMAEILFVIDGELDVLMEDEITTLNAGDLMVIPAGFTHAFAASESSPVDILCLFTPGRDRFGYYRLLDRASRGEVDRQAVIDSQPIYDNHYAESSLWEEHLIHRS